MKTAVNTISVFWRLPMDRKEVVRFVSCSASNYEHTGPSWSAIIITVGDELLKGYAKTQSEACHEAMQKLEKQQ